MRACSDWLYWSLFYMVQGHKADAITRPSCGCPGLGFRVSGAPPLRRTPLMLMMRTPLGLHHANEKLSYVHILQRTADTKDGGARAL